MENSSNPREKEMFAKVVRELLDGKRIMKDKNRKMWNYVSSPVNNEKIDEWMRQADLELVTDDNTCVCFVRPANTYDGMKIKNRVVLKSGEYALLLVLWRKYIDLCGITPEVLVTKKEIADEVSKFPVSFRQSGITNALERLKSYDFIDYDEDDKSENASVRIYSSVQFGLDWDAFVNIAEEYISSGNEDTKDSQSDSETESIEIEPAFADCEYDEIFSFSEGKEKEE